MVIESNEKYSKHKPIILLILSFLLIFIFQGCAVKLIADYDEYLEKETTSLQKKMEAHLLQLERKSSTSGADYNKYVSFYEEIKVSLSSMKVRAMAHPKNEITVKQIEKLIENTKILEKMHKKGVKKSEISSIRTAFEVGITAILKLELAKKRSSTIEK